MSQILARARDGGSRETLHSPVLAREVVDLLRCRPGRTYVDATLGPGGHSKAILEATAPDGRVIGIDLDLEAIEIASSRLASAGKRFTAVHSDFRRIHELLCELEVAPVDGIVADLGFSSLQVLAPERGFAFSVDGPLDMRYDRSSGKSAARLLEELDEASLRRLLFDFGEEREAPRIARAVARRREKAPIRTTAELAGVVTSAIPRGRGRPRIHPATKTFQALRIAVNNELQDLGTFVDSAVGSLRRGGRLAVIAFHSLEDRIVKRAMRALAHRCVCPPSMPVCGCGRENVVTLITTRPLTPSTAEREANPRSRSAKLRVVERL